MFKTRSPGKEQSDQATKSWKLEVVDKRGYIMKTLDRSALFSNTNSTDWMICNFF